MDDKQACKRKRALGGFALAPAGDGASLRTGTPPIKHGFL